MHCTHRCLGSGVETIISIPLRGPLLGNQGVSVFCGFMTLYFLVNCLEALPLILEQEGYVFHRPILTSEKGYLCQTVL